MNEWIKEAQPLSIAKLNKTYHIKKAFEKIEGLFFKTIVK